MSGQLSTVKGKVLELTKEKSVSKAVTSGFDPKRKIASICRWLLISNYGHDEYGTEKLKDLTEPTDTARKIAFGSCRPRFSPTEKHKKRKGGDSSTTTATTGVVAPTQSSSSARHSMSPPKKTVRITEIRTTDLAAGGGRPLVGTGTSDVEETVSESDLLASFGINLKQIDKILGKDTGPSVEDSERKRGIKTDKWKSSAKMTSTSKRLPKREQIKQRMDILRKLDEQKDSKETIASKMETTSVNFARMQYLNKEQLSNPAPNAYNIQQWPFQMKMNSFPFNSGTQSGANLTSTPSPAVYEVQNAEAIGKPLRRTKTWGGPQTIELPTIVRCSQEPYDWCLECDVVLDADYHFSKEFGSLCHNCFIQGQHSMLKYNRLQLETFKPARHCREYHYHDSRNNMINRGNIKDVKNMIAKEAYFARYPDGVILQRRPLSHPESLKWFKKTRTPPVQLICQKPQDYEAPRIRPTRGKNGGGPEMNRVQLQFAWLEKAVKDEYVRPWLEKYHRDLMVAEEKRDDLSSIVQPLDTKEITATRLDRYGSIARLYRVCLEDFDLPGECPPVDEDTDEFVLCPKGRRHPPLDVESKKIRFPEIFKKTTRKEIFKQTIRERKLMLRKRAANFSRKFYYAPEEPQNDLEEILKVDKMKPALPSLTIDLDAEREVIPILDYNIPPDYFLTRD